MATDSSSPWLIADIGATNTRCAQVTQENPEPIDLQLYDNADFDSLKSLLESYLQTGRRPRFAALAIAAPISGDDIQMINIDWRFNRRDLCEELDLESLWVINDFHAIACALPWFDETKTVEIGKSAAYRDGNRAVLGPGTGCGVAAWIADGGAVMSGEGGHVTLAAIDEREAGLIAAIRGRLGHCSAERVLSGPGLLELHYAMHGIRLEDPAAIGAATNDPACDATMAQFFDFLATVSADLALTTGATGGLFIAGGIVPKSIHRLEASSFRTRFENKGRYREYMQAIPTYVITDPNPGLTGLAAYVKRLQQ